MYSGDSKLVTTGDQKSRKYLSIYLIYIAPLHRFMIVSEVLYNIHLCKACQCFIPVWEGATAYQIGNIQVTWQLCSACQHRETAHCFTFANLTSIVNLTCTNLTSIWPKNPAFHFGPLWKKSTFVNPGFKVHIWKNNFLKLHLVIRSSFFLILVVYTATFSLMLCLFLTSGLCRCLATALTMPMTVGSSPSHSE